MIVYNVTSALDTAIESDWVEWMKTYHMPCLLQTKLFVECRLFKIHAAQEPGTVSYSAQYLALGMDDVDTYLQEHAPALRQQVTDRYGDKVVSFRTLLEEV